MARFSNAISGYRVPLRKNPALIVIILSFFAVWTVTLVGTTDLPNWLLENVLVFIALGALSLSYRRMPFSDLSYLLIFVFLCLHVYGSMHTYSENPFGFWLKDVLDLDRNHYDRIVHFSFGFLLAYPIRELFLVGFNFPPWIAWMQPIEITLSISAFYELIEWGIAEVFFPAQGMAFLGTQGDVWDAQKDILLALTGALVATTLVSLIKKKFKVY